MAPADKKSLPAPVAQAVDMLSSPEAQQFALYGLAALGAVKVLHAAGDVAKGVWKHFLRPGHNLRKRYGSANKSVAPWAVVTGGAGGIGRAYAERLAAAGFNLVIVDKDMEGLAGAKRDLKVSVETIHYDFADLGTNAGYNKLEAELNAKCAGKDVAILVNNVAEFQHKLLTDASWDYILRASNVNGHSYAAMAKYFVPKFLQRNTQGARSAVINVGTCAAEPQNPRYKFTIYGASKAYGHILSNSLHEMYSDKIDVLTVVPRQVETKMNPAGYMFTAQPAEHAKAVFDQLGYDTKTYGVFKHDLEAALRWKYTVFGLFDKYVQWCNSSRNAELIVKYDNRGNAK